VLLAKALQEFSSIRTDGSRSLNQRVIYPRLRGTVLGETMCLNDVSLGRLTCVLSYSTSKSRTVNRSGGCDVSHVRISRGAEQTEPRIGDEPEFYARVGQNNNRSEVTYYEIPFHGSARLIGAHCWPLAKRQIVRLQDRKGHLLICLINL
jgi:hypothetical protein